MESLLLLLAGSLFFRNSTKSFQKYTLPRTGCTVLLLPTFNHQTLFTSENELLHYANCTEGNIHFGVLCAELNKPLSYFEAEEKLVRFADGVRAGLNIPHNTGISTGHTLRNEKNTLGIIDFWQDRKGIDWKVKGYINGRYMAVLYVKNINEGDSLKQEAFLDSFEFPAA
jgi:hypothetical protein